MFRNYINHKERIIATFILLTALLASAWIMFSAKTSFGQVSEKPKVVLYMMLDDADYNDVGYQSSSAVTPNIDALADDGLVFKDFYAGSGICSPTRVSVLTGNNPVHYGLNRLWPDLPELLLENDSFPDEYYWSMRGLASSTLTIGQMMKSSGYDTYHIGKWHSGTGQAQYLPDEHGFDEFKIMKHSPYEGILKYQDETGYYLTESSQAWRPQYQADEIISFIENAGGNDVFVNWWPIEPHTPLYVPPTFTEEINAACCNFDLTNNRGKALATMYAFDAEFGRVIDYLKAEGLYDDSLIITTSDNGGYRFALEDESTRTFSGHKANLYEGGIRVPFVATWPNQIAAGISTEPMNTYDLMPTIAALVGYGSEMPEIDGEDLSPIMLGESYSGRERGLFWEMRTDSWRRYEDEMQSNEYAYREGCYKIANLELPHETFVLYDLCNDPQELTDISATEPVLFAEMSQKLLERRLTNSNLFYEDSLVNQSVLLDDFRLNVHHDDLTIYATIDALDETETIHTLYERGDGLHFYIDTSNSESPLIVADIMGVTSISTVNPTVESIRLDAPYDPATQLGERVGFVMFGYTRAGASIRLFVDGEEVDKKESPVHPVSPAPVVPIGDSVYAIINEPEAVAQIGDTSLQLSDVTLYATALNPAKIITTEDLGYDPDGDADNDGNPDSFEEAGNNNGDGNGDGVSDAWQLEVLGAPNSFTGDYTTIESAGDCAIVTDNAVIGESSLTASDASFEYPYGLVDFELSCPSPGLSATVTIYYGQEYDTSDWIWRKYDSTNDVYVDISSLLTFATSTLGTTTVTTAQFTLTDGDPVTDEDGVANGVIVDPSGPGIDITPTSTTTATTTDPTATSTATTTDSTPTSSGGGGGGGGSSADLRITGIESNSTSVILTGEISDNDDWSTYYVLSKDSRSPKCTEGLAEYPVDGVYNEDDTFTRTISGLEEETKYYVRLCGDRDGEYDDDSSVSNFTTGEGVVIIESTDSSDINVLLALIAQLREKLNRLLAARSGNVTPVNTSVPQTDTVVLGECPYFALNLDFGDRGTEVEKVQRFLSKSGDFTYGEITGYYGTATGAAVSRFQQRYSSIVLSPWNLTSPTGRWYKTTRKQANHIYGCDSDALYLEGVGRFE